MYKKRDACAKLLFCQSNPIAFLPLSLPSPSSLLKLPNVQERTGCAMETLPSRAPFFLASITFKPLLRRLPNMPMHNLQNSASFLDTVERAQPLCNYTKHQSYHQLLGSGCLPFTWANRSVPVWVNNRTQNSGLVNFVLESQSLFAQISSIYQKTATKP